MSMFGKMFQDIARNGTTSGNTKTNGSHQKANNSISGHHDSFDNFDGKYKNVMYGRININKIDGNYGGYGK